MLEEKTSELALKIFEEAVTKYHVLDDVAQALENPYPPKTIAHLFYLKNWIAVSYTHLTLPTN